MKEKFTIKRQNYGFCLEGKGKGKDINITLQQANEMINFLKNNLKWYAHHFELVEHYIRFSDKKEIYFSFDSETMLYSTWFTLYWYEYDMPNVEEKFKEIFPESNGYQYDFHNNSYSLYNKDKKTFQKDVEKFYKEIVIPYLEKSFGHSIQNAILEYKAMSQKQKDILNFYF